MSPAPGSDVLQQLLVGQPETVSAAVPELA
jgi:hypothetical protein